MSENDRSPPPGSSNNYTRHAVDQEIFLRDLYEVLLLIDFVSGRPDRNLANLKIPDPAWQAKEKEQRPTLDPAEALSRLVAIRYPSIDQILGNDAALILLAKERLAELARPARALTIAYTAMFIGFSIWRAMRRAKPNESSRTQLGAQAFPELAAHASFFKLIFYCMVLVLPIFLLWTALGYWDVQFGQTVVQRIEQLDKDRDSLLLGNPSLLACDRPESEINSGATALFCFRLQQIAAIRDVANEDLAKFAGCSSRLSWMYIRCWLYPEASVASAEADRRRNQAIRERVASTILVLSTYVLPVLFGILGAMVGAIRSIQRSIRESELAPRDLAVTVMGIPVGAVAGLAVGLFLISPGGTIGVSAGVTLTAAGLSFVAGYGSETFFKFVERLEDRVFTVDTSISQPRASSPT